MKPQVLILAGAAALLLMPRRAAAAPVLVAGAVRQDYPSPSAVAAQMAGRVLEGIFTGFRASPTPAANANPRAVEDARAAVRAGDTYYGAGANRWYEGNTEEARAAVRAGDSYYGQQPWAIDAAYQATGGAGFMADDVAAAFYGSEN